MQNEYTLEKKREMLGRLANVARPTAAHKGAFDDPEWPAAAADFIKRYGSLRECDHDAKEREVVIYAKQFREAWAAQEADTAEEMDFTIQVVNSYLDEIFGLRAIDPFSGKHPRIRANFETGRWELEPQNLLEVLALQLMTDRQKLIHCGCSECHRYFVKHKSRDRYCDFWLRKEREMDGKWTTCGPLMRKRSQYRSQDEHRDEINRRRRKSKGAKKS